MMPDFLRIGAEVMIAVAAMLTVLWRFNDSLGKELRADIRVLGTSCAVTSALSVPNCAVKSEHSIPGCAVTSGALDGKLSGDIGALDGKLSGDIRTLGAGVAW